MQGHSQPTSNQLFDWSDGPRRMTVIRGFPMYRSTGRNSKFKDTWFPFLGIDGTGWLRKPQVNLPNDVLSFFKEIELDNSIITLSRFGNYLSLCISASIGGGFWHTEKGIALKSFLKEKYADYFLTEEELAIFRETPKRKKISKVNDIAIANANLMQYGSCISVDFQSRLPSNEELSFFLTTNNTKILTALTMMLSIKSPITQVSYKMICKLAEKDKLLDYALNTGLLETHKNITCLTKKLLHENKNLVLNDLIKLNPLHKLLLPFNYKYFLKKYACRNILRKLPNHTFTERDLKIIKILDDLHLLDRYAELFLDEDARLGLFYLNGQNEMNKKNLKTLYSIYKSGSLSNYLIPIFDPSMLPNKTLSLLEGSRLFAIVKETTAQPQIPEPENHSLAKHKIG